MNKFGSWWLAKIEVLEGEEEVFSILANRTQSQNRAVGGKLFVTNRRLLFTPHLIDSILGGADCRVPLNEIADISVQNAGGDTFGGGLRNRLRINLKNGSSELFVINRLDEVIDKLKAHVNSGINR